MDPQHTIGACEGFSLQHPEILNPKPYTPVNVSKPTSFTGFFQALGLDDLESGVSDLAGGRFATPCKEMRCVELNRSYRV